MLNNIAVGAGTSNSVQPVQAIRLLQRLRRAGLKCDRVWAHQQPGPPVHPALYHRHSPRLRLPRALRGYVQVYEGKQAKSTWKQLNFNPLNKVALLFGTTHTTRTDWGLSRLWRDLLSSQSCPFGLHSSSHLSILLPFIFLLCFPVLHLISFLVVLPSLKRTELDLPLSKQLTIAP